MAEKTIPHWTELGRRELLEALGTASLEELETLEDAQGRLHLVDVMLRTRKGGRTEQTRVAIRVPRLRDRRAARKRARDRLTNDGLDERKDKDLFDEMERIELLWDSVRNPEPLSSGQHEPLCLDAQELEDMFEASTLALLYGKMLSFSELLDPRPEDVTAEEIATIIGAIAEKGQTSPLVGLGPGSQRACITYMARLSVIYLASQSSSGPSNSSAPES